jgi:hypothetical protein
MWGNNKDMELNYDALKRMIMKVIEEMSQADKNIMINKYGIAGPEEQSSRDYCMKMVAPEIRKDFINQLDTLEKASKGNLKKKVQEGGRALRYVEGTKQKNNNPSKPVLDTDEKIPKSKKLTKDILIKIIDGVLEEEELSRGEITKRREDLFPGWKTQRQLAVGIYEKKKEKKKNCSKGAPYHDEDGEFSSKANAKVYSLKFAGKGEKDCKRGQAKMKNGKELFTKLPCGREDEEGTKKAKYKCKDGELAT